MAKSSSPLGLAPNRQSKQYLEEVAVSSYVLHETSSEEREDEDEMLFGGGGGGGGGGGDGER
jgi:hypothetical protein